MTVHPDDMSEKDYNHQQEITALEETVEKLTQDKDALYNELDFHRKKALRDKVNFKEILEDLDKIEEALFDIKKTIKFGLEFERG